MIQKIYGVDNLIDWTVSIKAGKATMRVHFTGGATTARGIVPATFATADPVKQAIIEKSNYFKTGQIRVVQVIEVPDDSAAIARKARKAAREAVKTKSFDKGPKDEDESPKEPVEPATDKKGEHPEPITVSSLDDAKDYLNEHFGIAKSQLRSRTAIEEHAKEHGLVFFFKNA